MVGRCMTSPKWRIAAAIKRFPFVLTVLHTLVRLTRPRFTAGVTGVLFNSLGEVLIVEHVYHAYPQWGLPGGYVDRGEEPHEAIAREMREELTLPVGTVRSRLFRARRQLQQELVEYARDAGFASVNNTGNSSEMAG